MSGDFPYGRTPCAFFRAPPWRRGKHPGLDGFALIEVVIAIAVAAFILVSLLGLMGYASQVVQRSDKYARLTLVANQMLASLGSEAVPTATKKYLGQTNYFTYEGLPTNSAGAYFQCDVAGASGLAPYPDLTPVQIIILWPKTGGTSPFANTNSIVTSIFNYD